MLMTNRLAFHLVEMSPWPLLLGVIMTALPTGALMMIKFSSFTLLFCSLGLLLAVMVLWFRDVVREATMQGCHTKAVTKGILLGFLLFITSEVFFFISFFWSFFHSSLNPDPVLGSCWPPTGINSLNPFQVPLLNTVVLLLSGVSITWSHHSLLNHEKTQTTYALFITICLGFYFTYLQLIEYMEAPFSLSDGVYGSVFFVSTGFHGLHVIVGSLFLLAVFIRLMNNHMSVQHHTGFLCAAWYWHFVDVVWLFLYVFMYWWGS